MIITNKFGKTFGPVASFSGLVILCVGLFLMMTNIGGFVVVVIGAFIAFTRSYTAINMEARQARYGDILFGIVKRGEWMQVESNMQIGLFNSNKVYRTYSRSNRALDITQKQKLICLFDKDGKKLMALKNVKDSEDVEVEMGKLCNGLCVGRMK